MLRVIGDHPLELDEKGNLKSRIATIFPFNNVIITIPGIHATQRVAYADTVNQDRQARGLRALTQAEQEAEWDNSVDLIMEGKYILIRPDPDNMELAFRADEVLGELVPKLRIKFLHTLNEKIRSAIKRRGEYWRIAALPRSPDEMKQMIAASRIGISGGEIYYYSKDTGTRYLTCQEFSRLAKVDPQALRIYLFEIKENSSRRNRLGNPELDFFMAGPSFSAADFAGYDFRTLSPDDLCSAHQRLAAQFRQAVRPVFQRDDLSDLEWRNQMFAALLGQRDQAVLEEAILGLSAEFYMQIEWLPGSRIEQSELIPDSVFEDPAARDCPEAEILRDEKPRGFIVNLVREYGDLEYVNIGRVNASLSQREPLAGRRGVYVAEIKVRGADQELVQVIRMQKWGVREHLDEGKSLLDAMVRSEEYTEYILDRRLGCRQLGMKLPPRLVARRISEVYHGRAEYEGIMIWSPYFERDYVRGLATDKMPAYKLENEEFALRFARLLGQAAAPNMIVGRADFNGKVIFDDGDELAIEDAAGMPVEVVIADPTGTFVEYTESLEHASASYARPITSRIAILRDPAAFADMYINSLVERFQEIQREYRMRRQGFDNLFKYHRRNEPGSFAYRWQQILRRLDVTDAGKLGQAIRSHTSCGG